MTHVVQFCKMCYTEQYGKSDVVRSYGTLMMMEIKFGRQFLVYIPKCEVDLLGIF
jgi:hypothetical protein